MKTKRSFNSFLKLILPEYILEIIRIRRSQFYGKTANEVFDDIYQKGYWKGDEKQSISGPGSSKEVTQPIQLNLKQFITSHTIQSIGDIGCGDFNWMQSLISDDIQYTGYDIVKELISNNNKLFRADNIEFKQVNIIETPISSADLLICRDCLVHLDVKSIQHALKHIVESKPAWIALTNFNSCEKNINITTGNWRPLNFSLTPFNLPAPNVVLNDYNDEKSIAIWSYGQLINKV